MIQTETVTIFGKQFQRTYSDENRYVVRDGVSYGEAIDPIDSGRTYTEGDVIENGMTETEEKAMAYDVLMGVTE